MIVVSRVVISPAPTNQQERKITPRTPYGLFSGQLYHSMAQLADPKDPGPSYSVHRSFHERHVRISPIRGSFEPNALAFSAQGSAHYQIRVHLHLGLHPGTFRLWNTSMPIDGRHRSHKPTRQKTNAQYALQALLFFGLIHIYSR